MTEKEIIIRSLYVCAVKQCEKCPYSYKGQACKQRLLLDAAHMLENGETDNENH